MVVNKPWENAIQALTNDCVRGPCRPCAVCLNSQIAHFGHENRTENKSKQVCHSVSPKLGSCNPQTTNQILDFGGVQKHRSDQTPFPEKVGERIEFIHHLFWKPNGFQAISFWHLSPGHLFCSLFGVLSPLFLFRPGGKWLVMSRAVRTPCLFRSSSPSPWPGLMLLTSLDGQPKHYCSWYNVTGCYGNSRDSKKKHLKKTDPVVFVCLRFPNCGHKDYELGWQDCFQSFPGGPMAMWFKTAPVFMVLVRNTHTSTVMWKSLKTFSCPRFWDGIQSLLSIPSCSQT